MSIYRELQNEIDKVIGKAGSDTLLELLTIFNHQDVDRMLITFVVNSICSYYGVSSKEVFKHGQRKHREARHICYYILRIHLKYSFTQISGEFGKHRRDIIRAIQDVKYFIENPAFDQKLIFNYSVIGDQVDKFIAFIKNRQLWETRKTDLSQQNP